MGSLVIQVAMWRDRSDDRARVTSDASGRTEDYFASDRDEVLAIVSREIDAWSARNDGVAPERRS